MIFSIGVKPRWATDREKTDFFKIENEVYQKTIRELNKRFAKELGIQKLEVTVNITDDFRKIQLIKITMDGYTVDHITIDQYNNLSCNFPHKIPTEYLVKFRRFLNEYVERQTSYYHRTGSVLIKYYFEKYYKELSVKDIIEMCEMDDFDNEREEYSFRYWLTHVDDDSFFKHKHKSKLKEYRPDITLWKIIEEIS